MDDDSDGPLRNHRIYRLIYDEVFNHPSKRELASLHGSVICRGGSILSIGYNSPRANSFSENYAQHPGWTRHSELSAIQKVRRKIDLNGCVMYNLRIDKNGLIRNSRPCGGCEKLLIDYGIKKVFFSTENGKIDFLKIGRASSCSCIAA
jgi:deoxycytidylate deaminase